MITISKHYIFSEQQEASEAEANKCHAFVNAFPVSSNNLRLYPIILLMLFWSCTKDHMLSLKHSNKTKVIALQPIGNFDSSSLISLQLLLTSYFNAEVSILKAVEAHTSSKYIIDNKYSADSLVKQLSAVKKGKVVEVIGLTHQEIYIPKRHKGSTIQTVHTIRGYGLLSEGICVISDYSLTSLDKQLHSARLWKAVQHEVGHNLGLPHCENATCIMSELSGDIALLDKLSGDYCRTCKRRAN